MSGSLRIRLLLQKRRGEPLCHIGLSARGQLFRRSLEDRLLESEWLFCRSGLALSDPFRAFLHQDQQHIEPPCLSASRKEDPCIPRRWTTRQYLPEHFRAGGQIISSINYLSNVARPENFTMLLFLRKLSSSFLPSFSLPSSDSKIMQTTSLGFTPIQEKR